MTEDNMASSAPAVGINAKSRLKGGDHEADPFATARSGGSPRTGICRVETFTGGTIRHGSRSAHPTASLVPESGLPCEPTQATPSLFGDIPPTEKTSRPASNAPCSETKARTSRLGLSAKLTPSLITSGLIAGTTPLSIRQLSGQPIRALAFGTPDGVAAVSPREG